MKQRVCFQFVIITAVLPNVIQCSSLAVYQVFVEKYCLYRQRRKITHHKQYQYEIKNFYSCKQIAIMYDVRPHNMEDRYNDSGACI
jgi:hypothetical protein